jgi:Ca2+/Na+ antiporter
MYEVQSGGRLGPEMLLIAGGVTQYVATRISTTVLGGADAAAPAGIAIGQWLAILATTVAALVMGQPMVAISLIFGSSVACLSLVLGMTTYVNPVKQLPAARRVWPLAFVVALFLLVAGFAGHLAWYHAVMLLIMGGTYLAVWSEAPDTAGAPMPQAVSKRIAWGPLLLAIVLLCFGAWAAVNGALRSAARTMSPELIAATVLSPLLLLPILGIGTTLAQQDHTDRVVTALCGVVLLNLCLLLPVVILFEFAVGIKHGNPQPLVYPLVTWRLDTLLLLLFGFAMVPLSLGRWIFGRAEASLLIAIYVSYILIEIALSIGLVK